MTLNCKRLFSLGQGSEWGKGATKSLIVNHEWTRMNTNVYHESTDAYGDSLRRIMSSLVRLSVVVQLMEAKVHTCDYLGI